MEIQFLGATETVTGSKYILRTETSKTMIDRGLFQGYKDLRLRNWSTLPIRPEQIDSLLLTHAHIDHSGYIPLLVKKGFRGKIYCTQATHDLCAIMLPDSGYLQEEEARFANKYGYSKHTPAKPLYTLEDAEACLALFEPVRYEKTLNLKGIDASFHYAGHILGASSIRIQSKEGSVLFSGDLGRSNDPIMRPPSKPPASDYIVVESTYGNRLHAGKNPKDELAGIINRSASRGGKILLPVFAVGRAQLIIFYIYQLKKENKIPDIPVFLDSPMATDATKLFYQHASEHKLSNDLAAEVCRSVTYTHTVDASKELDNMKLPVIIISASGMATGGRILHHIKHHAPDHRNAIVFCGFQAGGTRGARMVQGEKTVKMLGDDIPIRAEVKQLDNISAHADYQEVLDWLKQLDRAPKKIFVTHGEVEAAQSLKDNIEQQLGWKSIVPKYSAVEKL